MSAMAGPGAAAVLVGLAVVAWQRPPAGHAPRAAEDPQKPGWGSGVALVAVGAASAVAVLAWAGPIGAVLAGVVGHSTVKSRVVRRAARRASEQNEHAFEACGVLLDELRAGRLPADALRAAATVDRSLAPAVRAAEVGGDVPAALRATLSRSHRLVAAAWQVAERQGSGLADAVTRVLDGLRADRRTARLVASELASARSTARLLVLLPVLALGMAMLSVDGVVDFLASRPGALVVLLGVTLLQLGTTWIDRIARSVTAGAA